MNILRWFLDNFWDRFWCTLNIVCWSLLKTMFDQMLIRLATSQHMKNHEKTQYLLWFLRIFNMSRCFDFDWKTCKFLLISLLKIDEKTMKNSLKNNPWGWYRFSLLFSFVLAPFWSSKSTKNLRKIKKNLYKIVLDKICKN